MGQPENLRFYRRMYAIHSKRQSAKNSCGAWSKKTASAPHNFLRSRFTIDRLHLPNEWTMNWLGEKKGEGIEFHVMLLLLLLIVIVRGSGAMSIDLWPISRM